MASTVSDVCVYYIAELLQSWWFSFESKTFLGLPNVLFFLGGFWVGVFYAGKSLQSNPGPDILLDPWTQFMHGVEGIFCLHGGMQSQADLVPSSLNSCVAKREGQAFIKLSSPLKTIPLHFFKDILYFTYLSLTFTGHCLAHTVPIIYCFLCLQLWEVILRLYSSICSMWVNWGDPSFIHLTLCPCDGSCFVW